MEYHRTEVQSLSKSMQDCHPDIAVIKRAVVNPSFLTSFEAGGSVASHRRVPDPPTFDETRSIKELENFL